jgi:hypothetical protein
MFVMTLHKCGFAIYNQMASEMPVIRLFARDGIVWFIAVLRAFLRFLVYFNE